MVRFFQRGWPMVLFFFLLGNIGQENVFYDILEQEKGFSTLKKKKAKKKIYLFFWQYRRGKCVLRCCRTKKAFVRYKNKKSKSRKIEKWHFPIFFLKAI